jgi:hypothetical protein
MSPFGIYKEHGKAEERRHGAVGAATKDCDWI